MTDMRRILDLMESAPLTEDEDYESEIETSYGRGTYNFPWTDGEDSGLATARFEGKDDKINVDIIHVTDVSGATITPDKETRAKIHQQALDFIGDE